MQKYIILRQGRYSYFFHSISVDQEANTLNANLATVDQLHRKYITAKPRKYGYSDSKVENEIHIYTKDTSALALNQAYNLPLYRIDKIEIIERDKRRTSNSYVLGGVITVVTVATVVTLAALASESSVPSSSGEGCSCPLVSTYDGDQYAFQGEIYTGAITQNIKQKDFLPLAMQPVNGEYQIRITNDLNEQAFTDYAHLAVIRHNAGTQLGIGKDGKTYLLSNPVSPASAILNERKDMVSAIRAKDHQVCSFDDTSGTSSINELVLTFQHSGDVENAKLVLQLRNSVWLSFIYEQYACHFGKRYDDYEEKISSMSADEIKRWVEDQQIPLTISVSRKSGWKEISKLNMVGMMANRELVIPIDIDDHVSGTIQVKLSSGFLFWELDYAAMDFTMQEPVSTTILIPYYAVDEEGNDVLGELIKEDEVYLGQYETGDEVTLKYKMTESISPDKSYSVVLLTKGYYELIRDYSGKPDIAFLKRFKEPEALSGYGMDLFQTVMNHQPFNQIPN